MRVYDFLCSSCGYRVETLVSPGEVVTCQCGSTMKQQFTTAVQLFINDRNKATNHAGTSRYKEWAKSPATVERIRKGDLIPEAAINTNPLSDHLNCMDSNDADSTESSITDRGV